MGYEVNTPERGRAAILARWKPILEHEEALLKKTASRKFDQFRAGIIACLIADGTVAVRTSQGKTHYELYFFPDDLELLKKFLSYYAKVYGRTLHFRKLKNYYRVDAKHKTAVLNLRKYANFSALHWTIPSQILNSLKSKKEFLKSYFDCEGYVNQKVIRAESVNEKGLLGVKTLLLDSFGIESKFYSYERKQKNWNTNYILVIAKKSERSKFLKRIGFDHSRKKKILIASVAELG